MTMTTVNVADLRQALRVIMPFTDRTGGFEVMECVNLEASHNNLVATASDRYVLGHLRILASGDQLAPTLLPRRAAKAIRRSLDHVPSNVVAHLRRVRKLDGPDFLEVATENLTIRVRVLTHARYPKVLHLFEKIDGKPCELDVPLDLNPAMIRPFAKAAKAFDVADVRWTFYGPKAPVRVEIGGTFTGLVMPRTFPKDYSAEPVPVGLVAA